MKRALRSRNVFPDSGTYHFRISEGGAQSRVHLRIEPDRRSVLLVNASTLLHLNPSATLMAYLWLNQVGRSDTIKAISRTFVISRKEAENDVSGFENQLHTLLSEPGKCPIHDLNLETLTPFSQTPSAPYRMDLAVTYACNNDCLHCYNVKSRSLTERSTEEWKQIIEHVWKIGIPHLVFTGGEPTMRDDLFTLIACAEELGQVTGLNTNGRKLRDKAYVAELVHAGLDHVQITLESHKAAVHDEMVAHPGAWEETVAGIENAIASGLFVMTNTTLLSPNASDLGGLLDCLATLSVPTVGLNALIHSGRGRHVSTGVPTAALKQLLEVAKAKTAQHNQKLIWYTPTQYCQFDPLSEGLGIKGCTAALYNMCIEPDGSVIPCQSYYSPLGNILHDSWDSIWNHPLAVSLRERDSLPKECTRCSLLRECGGGCPLSAHLSRPEPREFPELLSIQDRR